MRLSWYPSLVCARVVRIIVSVSPIAAATTKYSCKDHRGNQDGVGDSKYQYKDKTDDAKLFGFLQFVTLLLTEGLWKVRVGYVCGLVCI